MGTESTQKKSQKTGVLIVNLGTPDHFSYWPMRRYLAEFLMDKRVVDLNRWFWCPLLHFIILSTRPQKAGHAYQSIWNTELNESPLRTITRRQSELLQESLGDDVIIEWGMRYGKPSVKEGLQKLEGCKKVIVIPLYPQYAGATYGSVADAVGAAIPHLKYVPALQFNEPYYDDVQYIKLIADSIRQHYAKSDTQPDAVLTSFHGLPVRYCQEGDPYFCHCHKTARLVAEELGWDFVPDWRKEFPKKGNKPQLILTFQSVFGKEVWLQPYTDKTLEMLPENGYASVGVITPGFAADCVETLEEINIAGRESFVNHGGQDFQFIPCLNDKDGHIHLLSSIIKKNI